MGFKLSENFTIFDLLPPDIISDFKNPERFIDPQIIEVLESIIDFFERKVIVNNYKNGGALKFRGYRPPTFTDGAANSMHRYGAAADFNVSGLSDHEVRDAIMKNRNKFPLITRMEINTVGWTHVDIKKTGRSELVLFKP